jgi:hypothetical protein
MSELRRFLDEYLTIRRALGFKLTDAGRLLAKFVAFAERSSARNAVVNDLAAQTRRRVASAITKPFTVPADRSCNAASSGLSSADRNNRAVAHGQRRQGPLGRQVGPILRQQNAYRPPKAEPPTPYRPVTPSNPDLDQFGAHLD